MAAGGMLRAGLGKARGLWAEVLRGAGLARRSLGHEPQPPAEPEAPSPFPGREGNLPPRPASESPAREGGPGEGVVRELEKPHPQPIPQSVHHRSIPSRENRSAVSGRVDSSKRPNPLLAPVGWGVEGERVFSSLGSGRCVRREKGKTRC